MTRLYNKSSERDKRRSLRNNMPPAERLLWARLRGCQVEGYKFRRQYSIDKFVVDFYAPQLRLAIEVDGESHLGEDAQAYDRERQTFLEFQGTRVLRFTNQQVYEELDGVVEAIKQTIQALQQTALLPPPFPRGD